MEDPLLGKENGTTKKKNGIKLQLKVTKKGI